MSLNPGAILRRGFLALLALFLAAPLIVVASVSFNATRRMSFPPTAFSLRWYGEFFGDYAWMASCRSPMRSGAIRPRLQPSWPGSAAPCS